MIYIDEDIKIDIENSSKSIIGEGGNAKSIN